MCEIRDIINDYLESNSFVLKECRSSKNKQLIKKLKKFSKIDTKIPNDGIDTIEKTTNIRPNVYDQQIFLHRSKDEEKKVIAEMTVEKKSNVFNRTKTVKKGENLINKKIVKKEEATIVRIKGRRGPKETVKKYRARTLVNKLRHLSDYDQICNDIYSDCTMKERRTVALNLVYLRSLEQIKNLYPRFEDECIDQAKKRLKI